jgi:MFS transporter, DHA1 family, tetracycline resistance protein
MSTKSSNSILFLTLFLDLMGYGLIIPLLPDYTRSLGATATLIGIITASYSLTQFIASPILGSLSDKYGRKPLLLITIAISMISYIIFGLFSSLYLLLFSRLLAGAASGNISVAQAYLTDTTPPEKRTKALGMIGAALGLGFIFGPPIGGAVKQYLGIEWVGYVAALLAALNLISALIWLPESLTSKIESRKITFIDVEILRKIFASLPLKNLFTTYFLFMLGFTFLTITGVLMWKDRFGLDDAQIGYTFALIGIITAVIQALIGKLSAKYSEKKLLIFGLIIMAIAITIMPLVPANSFLVMEIPLIIVFAMGYALVLPTGASLVTQSIEQKDSGTVLGQYQSTAALARIIGPIIAASLYGFSQSLPFLIGGAILIFSLFFAMRVNQHGHQ